MTVSTNRRPAPEGADAPPAGNAAALALGFARHVERWSRAQGASDDAARLAGRVAEAVAAATADGHVCIGLDEAAQGDPATAAQAGDEAGPATTRPRRTPPHGGWRALLLASGAAAPHEAPGTAPLVIDGADRVYLHRYFEHERRLASRLAEAACSPALPVSPATVERLRSLFASNARGLDGAADWQQIAAALALRRRFVVVSGGPGTGKTTTVVNLLACLLAESPDARIALAAPTGKAAARMAEAIRERALHLPPGLRERLPTQASTVHRLLGVVPGGERFRHHAGQPLPVDALVVDEASMLDLALATRLLDAVPPSARIVLLGDKDQLSAVESGSVFAELGVDPSLSAPMRAQLAADVGLPPERIQAPPAGAGDALTHIAAGTPADSAAGALPDSTVWFRRNFRFSADSGIGRLAAAVNAADAEATIDLLGAAAAAGRHGDLGWIDDGATAPSAATRAEIAAGFEDYLDAVARDPQDVAGIVTAFDRFRVLCAVREGPRGVAAINAWMGARARGRLASVAPAGAAPRTTAAPSFGASASGTPSDLGHDEAAGLDDEAASGADAGALAMTSEPPGAWYAGRPVMVLRNDPLLKLYNGDIGLALPGADGLLAVVFPDPAGGWRRIPTLRLPAHQDAFAMTVHKSQGSEFDAVLVLLPERINRVLTRELLYTAVTRARRRAVVAGSAPVVAAAVRAATQRRSGLGDRLREALRARDGTGR